MEEKKSFGERFREAFVKAMRAEHEEFAEMDEEAPVYTATEGLVDVVDSDDKNLELTEDEKKAATK